MRLLVLVKNVRCLVLVIPSIYLKQQFKLSKVIRLVNNFLKDELKEKKFHFVCNKQCYQRIPMES